MLRRLIIATGTLGLILIGFGLYRSRNATPEKPLPPLPEITVAAASAPASQQTVPWVKDLRIAPGKQASFEFFDPKGELQYLMKTAEWKAESENELSLNKPELWKFMRNGQILRITADTGQISVEPAGKSNLKPKRGWLRNNVRISIDMTTRLWRQAHPGRDAIEQHPEHVIAIDMDSLYFDDDLSLIRTEENVSVHTARFDIASTGMKLVYSRSLDRLEHLVLAKKGNIVMRGDLDLTAQPSGPSAASRPVAGRAKTSAPTSRAARAAATSSAPASQATPTKYQDIYKAIFEGPVNVTQYRDDKIVARLDSDKLLELVFDMAQQDRQGTADEPEKQVPAMGSAEQATAAVQSGERTLLTWAGQLDITPLERHPVEQAKRTTRIKASGDKVVLEDNEEGNVITCQQLDYDAIQHSGRVVSEAPAQARLVDSHGGFLAGQDIQFDQAGHTLEIDGPGEAREPEAAARTSAAGTPSSEGPTKIRWTRHLLVRFQPADMPMPISLIPLNMPDKPAVMDRLNRQSIFEMRRPVRRSQSFGGNPLKGLMAQSALITGDAVVERGADTIHAEKLAITFLPEGKGKSFGPIQSAIGEGQVQLVSKDQNISADSLDVRFVAAGAGRSTPIHAIAQGHALAVQDKSRIEADFLDATLAEVPADITRGREQATAADDRTRPAVVAMTASGNVHITDPEQDLDLAGDALTAQIPDGRQVKDLIVKGTPTAPARVNVRDYTLTGPSIQADLQTQDVSLPSPGTLKLMVRQGPEGSRLDKPRPLVITWSDRMQMRGAGNQATFDGHVQALMASRDESGEDTAVTADHMTVYFRAVSSTPEPADAAQPSPAFEVIEKARQQITQVMPTAAEWLPSPRTALRSNRPKGDFAAQREPVKVIAEGNARAISSRYDVERKVLTSRLLIDGPVFVADLLRQHIEVPGKGKLLLENYALAKTAAKLMAAGMNPATLPAVKSVPEDSLSQTVFAWTNGMTFALDEQLAVFDGEVNMVYRSGGKVVLGTQLAQALGAKPSLLQVMPGRVASLNSDNLVIQFSEAANKKDRDAAADQWIRRAELDNMIATGNVYLNEDLGNGGSNFLTAGRVQYSGPRDTFVIQGSPGVKAKLIRQKDAQSPPEPASWDAFWWNRRTGEVSTRGVTGQSTQ